MQGNVKEVFISYAWDNESEAVADKLDQTFQAKGIIIKRDKREIGYRNSIKEFMERIGSGSCVIAVIDDKYLKSSNCMFELVQVSKNGEFHDRIFPIILASARIYDPVERIGYIKYWEDKNKELKKAISKVSPEFLQGIREDIDKYTEIRNTIAGLTNIFSNINTLTSDVHIQTDFDELFKAIERKLSDSTTDTAHRTEPIHQNESSSDTQSFSAAGTRSNIESASIEFGRLVDFMNEGNALILGAAEITKELFDTFEKDFSAESLAKAARTEDPRLLSAVTAGWYKSPLSARFDDMVDAIRQRVTLFSGGWTTIQILIDMLIVIIRDSYAPIQFHKMLTLPPPEMWMKDISNQNLALILTKHLQGNSAMYYVARYENATKEMKQFFTLLRHCQADLQDSQIVQISHLRIETESLQTRTDEIGAYLEAMLPIIGQETYNGLAESLARLGKYISKEYASERLVEMDSKNSKK